MAGPGWEWLLVCCLFQGALNGTGGRRLYTVDTLRFAARAFFGSILSDFCHAIFNNLYRVRRKAEQTVVDTTSLFTRLIHVVLRIAWSFCTRVGRFWETSTCPLQAAAYMHSSGTYRL